MEIEQETYYCENCQKETVHQIVETSLEIDYICKNCGAKEECIKTFF